MDKRYPWGWTRPSRYRAVLAARAEREEAAIAEEEAMHYERLAELRRRRKETERRLAQLDAFERRRTGGARSAAETAARRSGGGRAKVTSGRNSASPPAAEPWSLGPLVRSLPGAAASIAAAAVEASHPEVALLDAAAPAVAAVGGPGDGPTVDLDLAWLRTGVIPDDDPEAEYEEALRRYDERFLAAAVALNAQIRAGTAEKWPPDADGWKRMYRPEEYMFDGIDMTVAENWTRLEPPERRDGEPRFMVFWRDAYYDHVAPEGWARNVMFRE